MEHFFSIYKELEGKVTTMEGWGGPREARKVITECRQRYLEIKAAEAQAAKA
jgi:inorganic pyrophosphatase